MHTWHLIDPVFALRLTTALLHFLWQGAAIAVLAAVAGWLLRLASARARYAMYVVALVLMTACMPITFARLTLDEPANVASAREDSRPARIPSSVPSAELSPDTSVASNAPAGLPPAAPRPASPSVELNAAAVESGPQLSDPDSTIVLAASIASPERPLEALLRLSAPYVTVVYFAGVLVLLVRLLRGTWDSRRLRSTGTEVVDADLSHWIREQAAGLGLRVVPALRWCRAISVPVVLGVVRPAILLPASAATGLSPDQLRAVIAHELAHIRRYDLAINLLQRMIETLLFFHPAVWWISRQISREREEACDDLVLSAGYERTRYADALVRVAELSLTQPGRQVVVPATALAAAGASPTEFKRRILKILRLREESQRRPGRVALLLAATITIIALLSPVAWIYLGRSADVQAADDNEDGNTGDHHDPAQHERNAREPFEHTIQGSSLKLTFSADGRRLAIANGNPSHTMFADGRSVAKDWQPTVDIIDTENEKVITSLDLNELPHDANRPFAQGPTFIEVTAIAFSPDGEVLAVGTSVGQLKLFDARTGKEVNQFDDREGRLADNKTPDFWKQLPRVMGRVQALAFSPDGRRIAVCGESFADWTETLDRIERGGLKSTAPGRLKVFDVETGDLKFNPPAHSDMVVDVAYSPDGRYLASAGRWMDNINLGQFGNGIILWDATTGERRAQVDLELRGWMYDIEFSPDSSRILFGAQDFDQGGGNGTGVAAMLSTETLAILWRRPIERSAMAVCFNPQQSAVIVLTNREDLSYIDAETGQTQMALKVADSEPPQKQRCEGFVISPQGHLLAYGIVENGAGHIRFMPIGRRKEPPLLKALTPDGSPARIHRVQYAQLGFPLVHLPPWFGELRADGLVSLANLPDTADWLVVESSTRTAVTAPQPGEPRVIERILVQGMSPRNHNLSVKVSVIPKEADADLLRVAIENRTGADVHVSERDICLEAGMPVSAPLWGLSPAWTSAAPDRFPVTTIHDGQAGHLDLDWQRWVRDGLWYQQHGPIFHTGPTLTNPPLEGISIRVCVGTHRALPVEVVHPRILATDNPWPGAGVDTSQFRERAARVALDSSRLQGAWRPSSIFLSGSKDDTRDFPIPAGTVPRGEPFSELNTARMVIARAMASGVPNATARFRGRPAPDGPLFDPREATWRLNESYDPPTFDVTIPADKTSATDAVRRQFLYRLTRISDRVAKLELACNLSDPDAAPASWDQTPLMVYTFESAATAEVSLPEIRLEGADVSVERLRQLEGKAWGTVTLVDGSLNGEIAHALARAESIRSLRILGGDIAGYISWLHVVPGLVELELGGTIIPRDLRAVGEWTQLQRLKLPQQLSINVSGARSLAKLVNLKSLDLYDVDIDDASFAELAPLVHLEELNLTHTRITDEGLQTLAHFRQLKRLFLHRFPDWFIPEQLTDEGVLKIAQLRDLEVLSISGKITDEGLRQLATLPRLKQLDVLNTEITPAGLAALEGSSVESLTLSAGLIDVGLPGGETIAKHLRACPNLKAVTFCGSHAAWSDGDEDLQKLLPRIGINFNDP